MTDIGCGSDIARRSHTGHGAEVQSQTLKTVQSAYEAERAFVLRDAVGHYLASLLLGWRASLTPNGRTINMLFHNSNPVIDVLVENQHLDSTLDAGTWSAGKVGVGMLI